MQMSQTKLKQLSKLLKEWRQEFEPKPNHSYFQPMYLDILDEIIRQVGREIE